MRITKPERVVEVCDICHEEDFLQTCPVCGKRICLLCRGIMAGCRVSPRVCKECSERPDVQSVVQGHADLITPIIRQRSAALKALPAEFPQAKAERSEP